MEYWIDEVFDKACKDTLGEMLASHGFVHRGAYSIMKGITVEFSNPPQIIFLYCEGGGVSMELNLADGTGGFWRVDFNLAIWYQRVRDMKKAKSVEEQLTILAREVPARCADFLAADCSALDDRFCFPVNEEQRDFHLKVMRGKDD